jgi:hypothetical protein
MDHLNVADPAVASESGLKQRQAATTHNLGLEQGQAGFPERVESRMSNDYTPSTFRGGRVISRHSNEHGADRHWMVVSGETLRKGDSMLGYDYSMLHFFTPHLIISVLMNILVSEAWMKLLPNYPCIIIWTALAIYHMTFCCNYIKTPDKVNWPPKPHGPAGPHPVSLTGIELTPNSLSEQGQAGFRVENRMSNVQDYSLSNLPNGAFRTFLGGQFTRCV